MYETRPFQVNAREPPKLAILVVIVGSFCVLGALATACTLLWSVRSEVQAAMF